MVCICYLLSWLLANLGVWLFVLGVIFSGLVGWFNAGFAYAGFFVCLIGVVFLLACALGCCFTWFICWLLDVLLAGVCIV